MTRKDIIIVSLLINAGILALLFMLAINHDDPEVEAHDHMLHSIVEGHTLEAPKPSEEGMTVDQSMPSFLAPEENRALVLDQGEYVPLEREPVLVKTPPELPKKHVDTSQEFVEIKVKKGDALEKIARNNGTTVEKIKEANQLASAKLSVGQVLRIPVNSKSAERQTEAVAAASSPPAADAQKEEPQYYTIKSGDSPWKIAKQHNMDVEELLKMNDMNESRARNLKIGERIRVR
jgi:peptidoglycan DL-endopeptidase LytF